MSGTHPARASGNFPDELIVYPIDLVLESDDWPDPEQYDGEDEGGDDPPYRLPVAPDFYHKADVSGGAEYWIRVPDGSADPAVVDEPHGVTFVEYLRVCFAAGGFPGLTSYAGGLPPSLRLIAAELLPF